MNDKRLQKLTTQLTVLLADADHFTRPATRNILNRLGIKIVIEVADGLSAVETFRASEPDVVFLDLDLPIFGGVDAIQVMRARASKACAAASIFIMADEQRQKDIPASPDIAGVLTKGAGESEITRLLALAAQRKRARAE